MKKFRFRIGLREGCNGLNQSLGEWLMVDAHPEHSGVAIVTIQAESWDSFFQEEPRAVCCDHDLRYEIFLEWLDRQFDCRGIAIDCEKFTPRQLLDVAHKWEFGIVYDGPEPTPDSDYFYDEWEDED